MDKKPRLFVSYSHKDTKHFEEFRKQLVVLEGTGLLSTWHDRKLNPGDKIHEVIRQNLEKSDVICFLVSADFLTSYYAYRIEFEASLRLAESRDIILVPVIIRSCNWERTPLNDFQAANEDGEPVVVSTDPDNWWLMVAKSISQTLECFTDRQGKTDTLVETDTCAHELQMHHDFQTSLEDTQVQFQHRHCETVTQSDIYVFPDVKEITQEYESIVNIEHSREVLNFRKVTDYTLLFGDDQIGKTTLLRRLMSDYYEFGALPLLVRGQEVNKSDMSKSLTPFVLKQYSDTNFRQYEITKSLKVLLIDDFDEIPLNQRYLHNFLERCSLIFQKIIICTDPSFRLNEEKYSKLTRYRQYEILPMGHLRRGNLISTWNSLGRKETIEPQELESLNDSATRHINAIVRNGVLPPKPIYIITVLQMLDSARPADYSLTSYGHCYQAVIHGSLLRLNIKTQQFDLYLNYLAELSYFMFERGIESVGGTALAEFKVRYGETFVIKSHDNVINNLVSAGILSENEGEIAIKYKYIFFFFVAKHLSEHLEDRNIKQTIYDLCGKLHVEKFANILIFLVHHSRDNKIIDEILINAEVVFDGYAEATLDSSETNYLADLFNDLPKLIMERRSVDEERKKELAMKDEFETEHEEDVEDVTTEIIADMHRSHRIVEIIGQILRNRQSSLTREQISSLMKAAFSCGLKFLNFYLSFTEEHKRDMVKLISMIIEDGSVKETKKEKFAQQIFLSLCYGICYAVIKKLADSTGSIDLVNVASQAMGDNEVTPALRLTEVAMMLEFEKKLPKKKIVTLFKDLEKNPMAQRMLKDIVIRHQYMNSVNYMERQWISDKLEIPMKSQRAVQHKIARIGN